MKLYHSAKSPFVRKVHIVAAVLGLTDQIECIPTNGNILVRDKEFRKLNPIGQIPTLKCDDGSMLFGSAVICQYLETLSDRSVMGVAGDTWNVLRDAALGDSVAEAALQYVYETKLRPEKLCWAVMAAAWLSKIYDSLDYLEERHLLLTERMDLGVISIFCSLNYISWRLTDLDWRVRAPNIASWYDSFEDCRLASSSVPAPR